MLNHLLSPFKGVVKALFICSFVISLSPYNANSQTEPFDSLGYEVDSLGIVESFESLQASINSTVPDCHPPSYDKAIPVLFENSYSILISMHSAPVGPIYLKSTMEGSESVPITVNEAGDAVISGLPYHQSFVLSAENSCGELAPFYTFYTNETFPEENHVTIHSKEMFEMASGFGLQSAQEAVPMPVYLNNSTEYGVHLYEKLNFYQQFALDGGKYPASVEGTTIVPINILNPPGPPGPPPPPTSDGCECQTLVLDPIPDKSDGIIEEYGKKIVLPHGIEEEYFPADNNVTRFGSWRTKGAANDYVAHTRASGGADCDKLHELSIGREGEITTEGEILDPPSTFGEIAVNLICNDRNELPAECECDKSVTFHYKYQARLDVDARRRDGAGCKNRRKSTATALNYAVIYCEEIKDKKEDDNEKINRTHVMDYGRWEAEAECNTQFNDQWDQQFFNFLETIFGETTVGDIINADEPTDVINEGAEVTELVETFIQWIREPYFLTTPCQTKAITPEVLRGSWETTLEPNKRLTFYVGSSSLVRSAGQRRWISTARVRTAYSMVLSVSPGRTDDKHASCCSDWAAAFLGGAYDEPWHSGQAWRDMGHDIFIANPNYADCLYYEAGFPYSQGDIGACTAQAATNECDDVEIVIPRETNDSREEQADIEDVFIFTTHGRLVSSSLSEQLFLNQIHLQDSVEEVLWGKPAGLYFVKYEQGGQIKTLKYLHLE